MAFWKPEHEQLLVTRWNEGWSGSEIAEELARCIASAKAAQLRDDPDYDVTLTIQEAEAILEILLNRQDDGK